MTHTLIFLYAFIAGLTAGWCGSQFYTMPGKQERWSVSIFCGLLFPFFWLIFLLNR